MLYSWDGFVDCILQDRESHCNVADGHRSHELCLAIDRSLEQDGRARGAAAVRRLKPRGVIV